MNHPEFSKKNYCKIRDDSYLYHVLLRGPYFKIEAQSPQKKEI